MDLLTYLKSLPDEQARETFAAKCGSTIGHLRNVGYRYKTCAHKLAALIWENSGKVVSRESLCPDDYWVVWSELPAPAETGTAA